MYDIFGNCSLGDAQKQAVQTLSAVIDLINQVNILYKNKFSITVKVRFE